MSAMRQANHELAIATRGRGLYAITDAVAGWLAPQKIEAGLLTLFCRHTSASLLIQENADPNVLEDLEDFFERLAPEDAHYRHDDEGPDDMPSHIRAALTHTQLSIPIAAGKMMLGTWQGLYLFEHRRAPHRRHVALHVIGA
jgi:secondary thiamine-phosphate synthase enzyme